MITDKKKSAILMISSLALLGGCVSVDKSKNNKRAKSKSDFRFELRGGTSYNSNVSITELDNNSGADDVIVNLYGSVRYDKDISKNTEFNVRYSYSQTSHDKFSRFDQQTHFISTGLEHDFGDIEAGISYRYYDSSLDNDGFLSSNRISPYIKKRFGKKFLLRAFYAYSDKQFDTSIARDANENEAGADLYYFINGSRQYIQTQYSYKDVDSFGSQFDYGAHKFRVRYTRRIPFNGRRMRLRATYRFEQRNYDNITSSIATIRDDTRHRFYGEIEIPITDKIYSEIEYQHAINNSNLPSADYNRDLLTASIGVRF
jgi:hypothetical protein